MSKKNRGPENEYSALRLAWPPFLVMATLVFASSMARQQPMSPDIVNFDKIAHFCVFGLLATLLFRRLRIDFLEHRRWLWALAGVMIFGVCDEVLQFFNPARTFDPYDWIADVSGAILALALYRNWTWYRDLLETRLWGRLAKR